MHSSSTDPRSAPARVKPRLRGVSHGVAAVVAALAVTVLVKNAAPGTATIAALIYGLSLIALFTISAVYHWINWQPAARARLRRLDHSAIFLLIAGTYTPVTLLVLSPPQARKVLTLVWIGAGVGIVKANLPWKGPRALTAGLYILLGWTIMVEWSAIQAGLSAGQLGLLFGGGGLYTLGAAAYALRWPDPAPKTFGYHEVFHLLVIGAAICHFTLVHTLLHPG